MRTTCNKIPQVWNEVVLVHVGIFKTLHHQGSATLDIFKITSLPPILQVHIKSSAPSSILSQKLLFCSLSEISSSPSLFSQGVTLPPLPHPWFRTRRAVTPDTHRHRVTSAQRLRINYWISIPDWSARNRMGERAELFFFYHSLFPFHFCTVWLKRLHHLSHTAACTHLHCPTANL